MLRDYVLGALVSGLIVAPCARAEEVANADPLPGMTQIFPAAPCARAEEVANADPLPGMTQIFPAAPSKPSGQDNLYMLCAVYPKPGTCESVYRQAMSDGSIFAEAARAEYAGYARYLGGAETLTDADRQYLKNNGISVPAEFSAINQDGLHRVINDASLAPDAKEIAVNNFLSRAVDSELYCGINNCDVQSEQSAAATPANAR